MRFGRHRRGASLQIFDLTPMIDVVFLLIIFFMATARFAHETRAELDLPKEQGEQKEASEEAGLVVNITADGSIVVAGEVVALEDLEDMVKAEAARLPGKKATGVKLLVRADRSLDTRVLNDVLARVQKIGVGAARLATEVPQE